MRYSLRKLKLQDADDMAIVANNKNVSQFLRNKFPHPYTLQDAKDYISYCLTNEDKEFVYAIDVNGKVCGCISAIFRDDVYLKSCEIGYWLAQECWHKGIMTSVVKHFCEFLFDQYDIIRIDAEVFAENLGSRRVLEKNGFVLEGLHKNKVYKDGKYMDAVTYALIKN